MKKTTLTIVVVLALLLTTTLTSMAAPEDIPPMYGLSINVNNPVECSYNDNASECLELVLDNFRNTNMLEDTILVLLISSGILYTLSTG